MRLLLLKIRRKIKKLKNKRSLKIKAQLSGSFGEKCPSQASSLCLAAIFLFAANIHLN